MRKLTMFNNFDFQKWSEGKRFAITGVKFNENRGCVSLDVAIVEDHTDYGDPSVTNLYEKFKVHCVNDVNPNEIAKYPIGSEIRFRQIGQCTVYGDYSSSLSVTAVVQIVGNSNETK